MHISLFVLFSNMLIKLKYHRQITMIIECRSIRCVIILTCTFRAFICKCIYNFFCLYVVTKMSTKNTALKNTLDDIIILNLRERMRRKIILYNVMTIDYSCERENCRTFFAVCIVKALEFLLLNFAFFFAFSFFRHSWNY